MFYWTLSKISDPQHNFSVLAEISDPGWKFLTQSITITVWHGICLCEEPILGWDYRRREEHWQELQAEIERLGDAWTHSLLEAWGRKWKWRTWWKLLTSRKEMNLRWCSLSTSCSGNPPAKLRRGEEVSPFQWWERWWSSSMAWVRERIWVNGSRVKFTDRNRSGYRGNRSNQSGPVPVWGGFKPAQI